MRTKRWFEPDSDLPDGGMSNHLLHNIREQRTFELMKETFAGGDADDEPSTDDDSDEIDD